MPITKTKEQLLPLVDYKGKHARFTGNKFDGEIYHKHSGLHYQYTVLNQGVWTVKYLTSYEHGILQQQLINA